MENLKKERESLKAYVYPNKLERVFEDIKKVEERYGLRPRQLESIIHYLRMEDEFQFLQH